MWLPLLVGSTLLNQDVTRPPVVGDRVAPFSLATSDGMYEYTPGRKTVITVWAYWCETWRPQDARMQEVVRGMKGSPIDFFAVSIDGRWTDLAAPPAWARLLTDKGGEWSKKLHIDRVPYTVYIDEKGVIQWAKDGVIRSADLLNAIRSPAKVEGGTVYLTFDDFPSGKAADHELLDFLRAEEITASFFCVGDNLKKYPEIAKRAVREGHSLEVHGFRHTGDPETLKCAALIGSDFGFKSTWQRLPGQSTVSALEGGKKFDGGTINPYDYRRPGRTELMRRIMNNLKPGSVLQLHVGVAETVEVLPDLAVEARKRGIEFRKL